MNQKDIWDPKSTAHEDWRTCPIYKIEINGCSRQFQCSTCNPSTKEKKPFSFEAGTTINNHSKVLRRKKPVMQLKGDYKYVR